MAIRTNSDRVSYTYPEASMYPSATTFPGQYVVNTVAAQQTGAFIDRRSIRREQCDPSGVGPAFWRPR